MPGITIFSGGQTGVDRSALDAAIELNIPHSGWCPPERHAEDGRIPEKYNLIETPEERSVLSPETNRSLRTEWNVHDSDATVVFSLEEKIEDPGSKWTIEAAGIYQKPVLILNPQKTQESYSLVNWIAKNKIKVLNIAGPSENTEPGISKLVFQFLNKTLKHYLSLSE